VWYYPSRILSVVSLQYLTVLTSTTAQLLTACSRGRRTVRSCGRLLVRPSMEGDLRNAKCGKLTRNDG